MGFKSDREFLRNISMGAIGTRKVTEILRRGGFEIIELERYSSSNKIWATKVKRLRVPDLLCIKTGIRIESRAKSSLKITMSHAVNNTDRAWDKGLRDNDLVAFILCYTEDDMWYASETVNLFRVSDMRRTVQRAGLSRMKAASEGSEIQLTWPSTVPKDSGQVTKIDDTGIYTQLSSGRNQKYRINRTDVDDNKYNFGIYVNVGDKFRAYDTILASAIQNIVHPICEIEERYDFIKDLNSDERETAYAAVKALGHLPDYSKKSVPLLVEILSSHEDDLIRLEAASSLARLGEEAGWTAIRAIANNKKENKATRMETALILAELPDDKSINILSELAENKCNNSDLRSAATWGLAFVSKTIEKSVLLDLIIDSDELVAVHALCGGTRLINEESIQHLIDRISEDSKTSAGIVCLILSSNCKVVPAIVQNIETASGSKRNWLLYLLARLGRSKCEEYLLEKHGDILEQLEFFWTNHEENWTNRLDVADQIDFVLKQLLD